MKLIAWVLFWFIFYLAILLATGATLTLGGLSGMACAWVGGAVTVDKFLRWQRK